MQSCRGPLHKNRHEIHGRQDCSGASRAGVCSPRSAVRGSDMILIPFKNRETAKQRLSPMLQPEERHALAEAMLEDVFEAVGMWRGRPSVMVISGDPFACTLAQRYGLEVLNDERNGGETD